jgi:predicted lipoprotein with Yx(FWY)xxD motif
MRLVPAFLAASALVVAGCGGDDAPPPVAARETAGPTVTPAPAATSDENTAPRPRRAGTRIRVGDSDFGGMLFDSRRQAIYIFERDSRRKTVCYGACAEAWPPVFTDGRPVAGRGVDPDLLGSIERRDGRRQVTYAGRPLYYYAHEARGEVRCHNVNLNGGFWWVIGADGERRP